MKTRVGIVGPKDSVDSMKLIVNEYEHTMIPIYFEYKSSIETTEIVEKNQHMIDIWVFSGVTPYTLAKKSSSDQLFSYLRLNSSSLTKTLLNIAYNTKDDLLNISYDMLEEKDISEAYSSLNISYNQCHFYAYQGVTNINEIANFHIELYQEGKVSVCVTCLSGVYEVLVSEGIPVFRVTPTLANIRNTFHSALQQWESLNFKQAQLTVMLISIENINKIEKPHSFSYDLHRLNLELQSAILTFTESISGSFLSIGTGTFIIFSTRGSLKHPGDQSVELIDKLYLIADLPTNIGIGYGDSALAAEENARLALLHAQNYSPNSVFLVENTGTVKGPLNKTTSISFEFRNEDNAVSAMLKESGVSITSYNKILSVQRNLGKHTITASDVAEWLKMTERNARRLLNNLTNTGIAKIIGQESPATRGRPRNIYQVGMDYSAGNPE